MRVAVLSILAAGALSASAIAQETPPVDAPPAPPLAGGPPPAPDATVPPAPPVMAPPAPVEPPPPPPRPPPPPAPTEATSVVFNTLLQRLCMPLVRGGDINQLAPGLGFKKKRDGTWEWQYAKGYKAITRDPGNNPAVCIVTVQHPIEGLEATITDIHGWAMYRDWTLGDGGKRVTDLERTNRKWENITAESFEAIVLMTVRKANGQPMNSRWDQTDLIYSFQKN